MDRYSETDIWVDGAKYVDRDRKTDRWRWITASIPREDTRDRHPFRISALYVHWNLPIGVTQLESQTSFVVCLSTAVSLCLRAWCLDPGL